MRKTGSDLAFELAKQFVKDIEYFQTHGTGDMCRRYEDHQAGDGTHWIALRAYKLAAAIANGESLGGPKFVLPEDVEALVRKNLETVVA